MQRLCRIAFAGQRLADVVARNAEIVQPVLVSLQQFLDRATLGVGVQAGAQPQHRVQRGWDGCGVLVVVEISSRIMVMALTFFAACRVDPPHMHRSYQSIQRMLFMLSISKRNE